MALASLYTATLACFLLGCAIAALLTEPSHDALDESLLGDLPWVPGDFETFHARITDTKEQQRVV